MKRVAVIGAGISGLCSGITLGENGYGVEMFAEHLPLVPDPDVMRHEGQVLCVPRSERDYAMVCAEPLTYIIPRASDCVLGGINARHEHGEELPPDSTTKIAERCRTAGFQESTEHSSAPIGIRPFRRSGVRLEVERAANGRLVVHNYGHGGCGLSLSWGCAHKVLQLLDFMTTHPCA